ncbi:glycosyltransferase [Spongiibacter nanhainus]|uniref:Glycosyltransferase n=1 Tax=Spongiibacter nanhainus TaxID=2794344 RepID=A0A7T4R296_9GAMM|nr:glycosyltransferase [Spongiibacter nanhainus]QQD19090.1 glycosyltransferase [Spongiibacter nanhainus]
MERINNIAINPTGIGGTQTFSRVLMGAFPNVTTFCFSPNKEYYNAPFKVIEAKRSNPLYAITGFGRKAACSAPALENAITIFNCPCDLDFYKYSEIRDGRCIFVAHFPASHFYESRNYLAKNQRSRIRKLRLMRKIVCFSRQEVFNLSNLLGISTEHIVHLFHTVELNPRVESKNFKPNIVNVCRFDNSKKRLDQFIEVARRNESYNFHLYGDGVDLKFIEKLGEGVGNLFIHPPATDLIDVYASSGILLVTSDTEAFGISILEALSQGTPVLIAKNTFENARKLVLDDYNGFVCELFNHDIISERLKYIQGDYRRFSKNSLLSFRPYSKSAFKEKWAELFSAL